MPHLGLQNDEALFGAGLYDPIGLAYWRWVFGHRVPVLLMSYLGALKCWLWAPVFALWPPTISSIRVPALLAGTATVWLFFALLRHVANTRAAVAGVVLLAADTSFLLTTTFDWGPVALQHLFLVAGVLLLAIFCRDRRSPALAGAAFLFGLAVWDKALFCWLLAGLGAACLLVYPRELVRLATPGRAAVAVAAFGLGALPLLLYNFNSQHRFETFRSNASWSADDLPGKARLVRSGLDGSALFGWLVAEDYEVASPLPPRTALERASAWLAEASGRPRRGLLPYAFLLAFALFLWLWRRQGWKGEVRLLAATLVFLAVAWLQMALTRNAGGGLHHTVLLWPAPHLFVAVAFAAASRYVPRGAALAGVLTALIAGSGVLVTNNYYLQAIRNGGGLNFTDAIFPLSRVLRPATAQRIFVTDWGILDSLRLLNRGSLMLAGASDPVSKPSLDAADREVVRTWVREPSHLFVGHTEGNEFFPGARQHLLETAEGFGLRREMLHVVKDRRGRPIFEVFRFVP